MVNADCPAAVRNTRRSIGNTPYLPLTLVAPPARAPPFHQKGTDAGTRRCRSPRRRSERATDKEYPRRRPGPRPTPARRDKETINFRRKIRASKRRRGHQHMPVRLEDLPSRLAELYFVLHGVETPSPLT
jgi:hypothetical protein